MAVPIVTDDDEAETPSTFQPTGQPGRRLDDHIDAAPGKELDQRRAKLAICRAQENLRLRSVRGTRRAVG